MNAPEMTDRERCAWALYCQAVTIAARDFWWELSPSVQATWLAEADKAIAQEAANQDEHKAPNALQ